MKKTLKELAEFLGGTVAGDETVVIEGLASLDDAVAGQITFLANPKYASKVAMTKASAIVLPPGAERHGRDAIHMANPYLGFAKLLTLFHVRPLPVKGVSEQAYVGANVTFGADVTVHAGAAVMDNVRLGDRVTIFPGAVIYEGVEIGEDSVIHANVSIRERCRLGRRVTIHNNTVIGSDGFGYAPDGPGWYKIPQMGIVVVEDDVEIGANTAIDRAALAVTRIGRGSKIDNLVQIAHNCMLGENCMIAGQVGIAGSAKLGNHVTLGGNVGIAGHLEIGDNTMVGGMSGISGNVPANQIVSGIPAMPHREWLRSMGVIPKLPELRRTVGQLEKRLAELEAKLAEKP